MHNSIQPELNKNPLPKNKDYYFCEILQKGEVKSAILYTTKLKSLTEIKAHSKVAAHSGGVV